MSIFNFWDKLKAKNKEQDIQRLKDEFYIRERDNVIWIMHNGVAVNKLPSITTTEDMISILSELRENAVEYAYPEEKETSKTYMQ